MSTSMNVVTISWFDALLIVVLLHVKLLRGWWNLFCMHESCYSSIPVWILPKHGGESGPDFQLMSLPKVPRSTTEHCGVACVEYVNQRFAIVRYSDRQSAVVANRRKLYPYLPVGATTNCSCILRDRCSALRYWRAVEGAGLLT